MENQTITQKEISTMTGLPLPVVSEALFGANVTGPKFPVTDGMA